MLDDFTKGEIAKVSHDLLKISKGYDVFPTPVDKILDCSNLIVNKTINLSTVEPTFYNRLSISFTQAFDKFRALLDRREKTIYLDLSQTRQRQNFVKLHEIGHEVLPWQKETYEFLDSDDTLDPYQKEQFEAEANFFASLTLFQHNRFEKEMKPLPLSMDSAHYLAKRFGSSVHAALRRYVEHSDCRCALLILQDISGQGLFPQCTVRDYFTSPLFEKDFGKIEWNTTLGFTWSFVKDYYYKKKYKKDGQISLKTSNGSVDFQYHFFDNSYNAFVLFFPMNEKTKSKIKFVVSGK